MSKKVQPETPASDPKPSSSKRVISIIAILAVLGAGAFYFSRTNHKPEAQQVSRPDAPLEAKVMTVTPHNVPYTSRFLAQTEASKTVPIRARVSGFLQEQGFEEGKPVTKDQVLFEIDPEPFQVLLDQAEAGLLSAQANLTRADQQVKRFAKLAEVQQAAVNELEQAQQSQRVAAAAIKAQQSLIDRAKLDLRYATIKSPIEGVIGERVQDLGSYVGPAADAMLATVRSIDPLYVRFTISEKDILTWQRLSNAEQVTNIPLEEIVVKVILPDDRVFPHTGTIDFIDVAVDPSTATAVVRAQVPNPDHTLRPGQFVNVEISGNQRIDVLTVPQVAVSQNPTGASVYILDDEGKAKRQPVELGEWAGLDWIITSGLKAGDQVVVDHQMQIRPGVPIKPVSATATAKPAQK